MRAFIMAKKKSYSNNPYGVKDGGTMPRAAKAKGTGTAKGGYHQKMK